MATPDAKSHMLDILDKQRLYCPAPVSFNDPFECQAEISFKAPLSVKNGCAKERLMKEKPNMTEAEAEIRAPARWQQVEQDGPKEFLRWLQYDTGVVSFSILKNDILMWAHYAGSHNGVCIEFRCTDEGHVDFFAQAQPVQYQQHLPKVNFYTTNRIEKAQAFILTKADHWSYEQEWRIVIDAACVSRYLPVPQGTISAVYLGCKISSQNRDEVLGRISATSPRDGIRVFQAQRRSDAYALTFEPISNR